MISYMINIKEYVYYRISHMISHFIYDIIYDMISYMISVRLQLPILPWHSALMQTMVGMSVMLTWTDRRMPTRRRDYADQDPLSDMDMEEDGTGRVAQWS